MAQVLVECTGFLLGAFLMGKVVYVTGAPASGKSSSTRLLVEHLPSIERWEYGQRLTKHLQGRGASVADQEDLRRKSSKVASADAIAELDKLLLHYVEAHRHTAHVLIDSHPVTKEDYGFRITAFSHEIISKLQPDEIWVFYTAPEVTVQRIRDDPEGRPLISLEVARMHTFMQASVAAAYGIAVGCPVYMFDTDRPRPELLSELLGRLED